MTNETFIDEDQWSKYNNKFKIYLGKNNEYKEIKLKNRKKIINKEYNITLIEIKKTEFDCIELEIDEKITENKQMELIGETIYTIYHSKDKNASISYSVLEKLDDDNNKFKYISSINNDNSLTLIFNLSSFYIRPRKFSL